MAENLFDYGKSAATPTKPRAEYGGCTEAKELPYSPPKGPTSQMQKGPGLHGTNHGQCGTQGKR